MSKIEWTEKTWNPIAGCSDVSEGCRNCYARTMAKRLAAMGSAKYDGLTVTQGSHTVWTGKIAFDEAKLLEPLRRKTPTMYFVNSMSDLFYPNVTDEMRDKIFAVMALCPQHTFQVLTKRPERMWGYLTSDWALYHFKGVEEFIRKLRSASRICRRDTITDALASAAIALLPKGFLPNVWLGVSVEDQKTADARIPWLLHTPAAVRFVSAEPLLGEVNMRCIDWVEQTKRIFLDHAENDRLEDETRTMFAEMLTSVELCKWEEGRAWRDALTGAWFDGWDGDDAPEPDHPTLDWVIVGGESGPKARPMHPDWARSLRYQCVAAGVPFFFKQWGEWEPSFDFANQFKNVPPKTPTTRLAFDGHRGQSLAEMEGHSRSGLMVRTGKKAAGDLLDGKQWHQMPSAAGGALRSVPRRLAR